MDFRHHEPTENSTERRSDELTQGTQACKRLHFCSRGWIKDVKREEMRLIENASGKSTRQADTYIQITHVCMYYFLSKNHLSEIFSVLIKPF